MRPPGFILLAMLEKSELISNSALIHYFRVFLQSLMIPMALAAAGSL
jgi:hypothetical protein